MRTPSGSGSTSSRSTPCGGTIGPEELRATPETLRRQSAVALAAGRTQLADNLARAAELATCRATRSSRSTPRCARTARPAEELEAWATRLETELEAPLYAAFVREAAAAYAERGPAERPVSARRSERFVSREQRELRRELLISPYPELGLVAMDGPNDPEPGLVVEDGRVVAMDGRRAEDFDVIDRFVARYGLDLEVAAEAAALADDEIARRLVDVDVPRAELVRLSRGLTPARLARVVSKLDPVELMFALKKLRARRAPANQAHVTNLKENPALLAADAAEAGARGFAEVETTVGVSRYAPLNAIAILVGSQTGRPGVMTQCAVEERRNLQLAIQGLVTYAETLSVYGTEPVFVDGDDTPWSKAFLASAYASRGVKVRFTSGGGSEALMGHAQGYSMLYLEARCLAAIRAAGSQGVQNGSISCVALVLSVPGGVREILAENVLAAWLDLEVASGNDAIASHSPDPEDGEADGAVPPGHGLRHLRLLGDAEGGQHVRRRQLRRRRPRGVADRPARLAGRRRDRAGRRGRRARGAREGAREPSRRSSPGSASRPSRTRRSRLRRTATRAATCPIATVPPTSRPPTACSTGPSLRSTSSASSTRAGFADVAEAVLGDAAPARLGRLPPDLGDDRARRHGPLGGQRPEPYEGPGTGYRLEGERWELLAAAAVRARPARDASSERRPSSTIRTTHEATLGDAPDDVVSPSARRSATRSARRSTACRTRTSCARSPTACARAAPSRGSSASAASPTSPSSATTARSCRLRASRSACSRRARR